MDQLVRQLCDTKQVRGMPAGSCSLCGSCTVIMRCCRWVGALPPLPLPPPLLNVLPATSPSDLPAGLHAVWRPAAIWRLAAVCWLVRRQRITGLPFTPPCCWQPGSVCHVPMPMCLTCSAAHCAASCPARCPHAPAAQFSAASVLPCFRVPTLARPLLLLLQGQAARLPAVPVGPKRQLRRMEGHSHRRQPPGSHQRAAGVKKKKSRAAGVLRKPVGRVLFVCGWAWSASSSYDTVRCILNPAAGRLQG